MNLGKLQDTKLIQKFFELLCTNNEKSEREIKETTPFTISTEEENKVFHCFHCFPSICHEMMGPDAMILVF